MEAANINIKTLRGHAARHGMFSVTAIAAKAGVARETVYFAIARPSAYPRAFRKIMHAVGCRPVRTLK
jgi:DNA-binding phage protein